NLAAFRLNGRDGVGDGANADRAAERVERALRRRVATFRDQSMREARIAFRAGRDQVEIGSARDLEGPAEDALVELARPLDVGGEYLEMGHRIGHRRAP